MLNTTTTSTITTTMCHVIRHVSTATWRWNTPLYWLYYWLIHWLLTTVIFLLKLNTTQILLKMLTTRLILCYIVHWRVLLMKLSLLTTILCSMLYRLKLTTSNSQHQIIVPWQWIRHQILLNTCKPLTTRFTTTHMLPDTPCITQMCHTTSCTPQIGQIPQIHHLLLQLPSTVFHTSTVNTIINCLKWQGFQHLVKR